MSEQNREIEQPDLTERVPPSFERDELGLHAPADDSESKPRTTPPPIPAAARTSRSMRAASVPPPIPGAARTSRPMRAASVPPPIPQRPLTQSGRTLVPKIEEAVDVDLTSLAPTDAPETEAAPLDIAPHGSARIAATRDAAVIDVPSLALANDWSISGTADPAKDWSNDWSLGNNAEPANEAAVASTAEPSTDSAANDAEPLAEEEAPAVAPALPTFMLTAARTSLPTPLPLARDARRGTLPPPIRPSTSSFVVAPPPVPTAASPSQVLPAVSAFPVVIEAKAPARHEDPTPLPRPHVEHTDEVWFDSASSTADKDEDEVQWGSAGSSDKDEEPWDSTSNLHRKVAPIPVFKLGIAAVLLGGLSAMTVILLRGDHDAPARRTHHAAIAQEQTPAPTPAPVVAPAAAAVAAPIAAPEQAAPAAVIPEPAPVAAMPEPAAVASPPTAEIAAPQPPPATPTTHELPFTTEPEGATVTLISDGVTSVVGETPLNVNIDPARTYDIVLTRAGYRTRLARIDPKAEEVHVVLVSNDEPAPARVAKVSHDEPTETPPPTTRAKRTEAVAAKPAPTARAQRPEQRPATAEPRPTRVAAETPKGGSGILMVSSKPPCEIAVDGVATMLTTPQRAIKLKPGKHKVTLFNTAKKIDKTFEVAILPGQPTKLIRDFMSR